MLGKKIYFITLVLLLSTMLVAPANIQAVASGICTLGDTNGDGVINAADETSVAGMVAGTTAPTLAADLDGDGIVSPSDVSAMRLAIATAVAPVNSNGSSNCALPTGVLTYSKDNGATWNTSATVKAGDILKIKAVFSGNLPGNGGVFLSIDNSLESNAPMAQIDSTHYSYDLNVVTISNISPATVSIKYGSLINNNIVLTNATFDLINGVALSGPLPSICYLGDTNGDGFIDAADGTSVAAMVAGTAAPTLAADIDGDGIVSPSDVAAMRLAIAQGATSPLVTSPVSCDLPTAVVTYSKDAGATYASTATVKKDDILKIKATLSGALSGNGGVFLSISNGLESNAPMAQIDSTHYSYDLNVVSTGNISPATVSINYGSLSNNSVNITSGSTFIISNTPVSSGGGGYGGAFECQTVTYSDWSACTNGQQTRTVVTTSPVGCQLTLNQTSSEQQSCTASVPEEGQVLGEKFVDPRELQLTQIYDDAHYIWPGDMNLLLGYMGVNRNLALEQSMASKYGSILGANIRMASLDSFNQAAITNFLTYGTKTTLILGAGERAGVLNSYKAAYNQLPKTEEQWRDAIKIANGRFPSQTSAAAISRATINFKRIYTRTPDMNNANDSAAMNIMAYGLRPQPRNIGSEAAAIKIFKGIYAYYPVKATAWDVVRAIAYSGATR